MRDLMTSVLVQVSNDSAKYAHVYTDTNSATGAQRKLKCTVGNMDGVLHAMGWILCATQWAARE